MLNAFLIGLLITLIYSILGVNLFGDRSENNFATFARAMFTVSPPSASPFNHALP